MSTNLKVRHVVWIVLAIVVATGCQKSDPLATLVKSLDRYVDPEQVVSETTELLNRNSKSRYVPSNEWPKYSSLLRLAVGRNPTFVEVLANRAVRIEFAGSFNLTGLLIYPDGGAPKPPKDGELLLWRTGIYVYRVL